MSNGLTIAVPASAVPDGYANSEHGGAGACARGWFLCPDEAGQRRGCCPAGYQCGTASCTLDAAATAEATVAKELPFETTAAEGDGDSCKGRSLRRELALAVLVALGSRVLI